MGQPLGERSVCRRISGIPTMCYELHANILLMDTNPTHSMLTDYDNFVILLSMSMTEKTDTVWFTTKGQVVIPLRLRKQFEIEDGTKAVVQATPEGILLKPVTAALIRRALEDTASTQ